ncbi:MAG: hypothetical protein C4536_00810 [Actinobacteria bacterium]|jgi:hypothetical protein|nr:MAG: hypothetical protein C4536_00810 [Actinomycetota bacterium]
MEVEVRGGTRPNLVAVLYWTTIVSSFLVLAWLNGRDIDAGAGFVALYTVLFTAFAVLSLAGIGGAVYAFNPRLRAASDYPRIMGIVVRGFLMMLPFMLMALVAELFLDWNSAQVFTQAGIMACGSVAGAEVVKSSGGKIVNMIAPVAGAFLFSFLWMLLSAAAQAAAR